MTESRARLLIQEIWNFFDGNHAITEDEIVQSLKNDGFIKQSKKEVLKKELEEFYNKYDGRGTGKYEFEVLYKKAQAYIQELEEKVNGKDV